MSSCIKRFLRFLLVTVPILLWDGVCLLLFVVFLSPGFARFAWYYFVVAQRHVVRYGTDSCRQTLDVYTVPSSITSSSHQQQQSLQEERRGGEEEDDEVNEHQQQQQPVLVFVSGGAWVIGYKMWAALLARCLTAAGIVVVIPDYRNYPMVTVPDMVQDVELALQWTRQHVHEYGGDADNIVLAGQSAGGHLIITALLRQQEKQMIQQQHHQRTLSTMTASTVLDESSSLSLMTTTTQQQKEQQTRRPSLTRPLLSPFQATDYKGVITLSAPFSLPAMQATFIAHGMDDHLVDRIFGGQREDYDPFRILQRIQDSNVKKKKNGTTSTTTSCGSGLTLALPLEEQQKDTAWLMMGDEEQCQQQQQQIMLSLPPIRIYHGDEDRTVPHDGSVAFASQLRELLHNNNNNNDATTGSKVEFSSYQGWSHTDAILEAPMRANHQFHRDVFLSVQEWTTSHDNNANSEIIAWPNEGDARLRPLCPEILVKMGRIFMPF